MRGMVLCAGLGTRLRPLTEFWPKPALPLLGAPLLRSHLVSLHAAGIREVGINTHHLGETMRRVAEAETARLGMSLTVVHEDVLQGTGGGIRSLREFLSGSDPFVVLNGDIAFEPPLPAIIEAHHASGADGTMVLQPLPEGERYGAVEADASGRIRRIAGVGPGGEGLASWHFTGVHVMRPRVFDFMTDAVPEELFRDVYARLFEAGGHIQGVTAEGDWADLGTPTRYLSMVLEVVSGARRAPSGAALTDFDRRPDAWVHRAARVDPSAMLEGGVVVEAEAQVGANARLSRCVLLPGARVEPGARLENKLVGPDFCIDA